MDENKKDYELTAMEENISQSMHNESMRNIKPHSGSTLTWKNIEYSVKALNNNNKVANENNIMKTVLYPMSGEARPGELLGVMGTSGAGIV